MSASPEGGHPRILAHDDQWQTPAATERHAFAMFRADPARLGRLTYVAFPWATLIDKTRRRVEDQRALRQAIGALTRRKPADAVFVTVCQHVDLVRHLKLFTRARIDHVFWSHASGRATLHHEDRSVTLHAFPLFPVQFSAPDGAGEPSRTLLFSFVGARATRWHLAPTRDWILEHLAGDARGLVIGRDGWHYNRLVYDLQILGTAAGPDGLVDDAASAAFREILGRSLFSLCPSGTGPNSIRLWESIGAGAVPVILSDGWAPPGNPALWDAAAIVCAEDEAAIRALPDRLAAIAADPAALAGKRRAMRQLWLLYGPEGFVYDIQKLALAHPPPRATPAADRGLLARLAGSVRRRLGPAPRPPRIFLYGRHASRTPIAYAAYRPFFDGRIERVERPADADMLVAGFWTDIRDNADEIARLRAADRALRIVVLSEEPLWDTVWSAPFAERAVRRQVKGTSVDTIQLNHFTTGIYAFRDLPYFVTTDDDFVARYLTLFARNRSMTPDALLAHWRRAALRAAFYAARRTGARYAPRFPERDVEGLSRYRTEVAEAVRGEGVLRVGLDWPGAGVRQDLPDWHLDKLATLDRRTFVASAIENTHERHYVTEKIFDAFAVQAVPLYVASPRHRIGELVDPGSFINLHGLSPQEAADAIRRFEPDRVFAQLYAETQHRLLALFSSIERLAAERDRVATAVTRALVAVMQGDRPGTRDRGRGTR